MFFQPEKWDCHKKEVNLQSTRQITMRRLHLLLTGLALIISLTMVRAQVQTSSADTHTFWLGADISGTTELEARGWQLYNAAGEPRENTVLMKELGLNAIRLRVWVNPRDGFCSKEDVLTMALRAQSLGMPVMIDFHYSDWWADPGKQPIPKAWEGMSLKQMRKALARHTRETLQLLKKNHIDVRWIQIGNETTNGMLWETGRAETNMRGYALLTKSGYEAAKRVYPNAQCIIHLDAGCDINRYHFILNGLRENGTTWDMIGISVYPYWDMQAGLTTSSEETLRKVTDNVKRLATEYSTEVMVVETGVEAKKPEEGKRFMSALLRAMRYDTDGHCHGVFYWAPEAEGHYPLGAFDNHRPTVIMEAFGEMKTDNRRYEENH